MSDDPAKPMTTDDKLDLLLKQMAEMLAFKAFAEPKLYDTKPIWEQALKEILETRIELGQRIERVEKEIRRMRSITETMTEDLMLARADVVRDLNQRVDLLESPRQ
ncbi:MAG: hypothetical protein ACKV2V_13470 [Blastocatellia bacterium]